jgi:hypothetical protein
MSSEQDLANKEPLDVVAVCGPTEAQMIEEVLNNNGIDCTLQGDVASTPWPGTDLEEVRVWVKHEDAPRAQELVDAFFTPVAKDELDEGESDLGVEDPDEPGGFPV